MARGNIAGSQTTKATLGVRELIYEGAFAAGERVAEVELADRLQVSRTPLRTALLGLAHEGLLEPLPGGGFVVASFGRGDVVDAIELRGVLEGTAARLAAERLGGRGELEPLERAVNGLDDVLARFGEDGMPRYIELNESFHAALVELAKSAPVARAIANVTALPFASPSAFLSSQALLARSREILTIAQHQHRALVEAIRDGHGTRAEEIAREHARLARLNLDLALEDRDLLAHVPGALLLAEAT